MSSLARCTRLGMILTIVMFGCQEGVVAPVPDEPLTLEEVTALFTGVRAALQVDSTAMLISETSDGAVVACPLGGQVTLAFSVREEQVADTARIATDVTLTPAGCQLSSEGYAFTVDGNPSVRDQMTITIVGFFEVFVIEGSTNGTLDWALDGREGTCMIDLVLSAEPDLSGPTPTVAGGYTGMMCGLEVEFEVGIGVVQGQMVG